MLRKKIFIPIILSVLILISFTVKTVSIQNSLATKVLRLHVLANSNSFFDQELKIKVKDDIVSFLTPKLKKSKNLEETKKIISDNLASIKEVAESSVQKFSNYTVTASLSDSDFPTKNYDNYSFPAGNYEALKIVIGEGKGNNWWCVMFPPLCFTNSSAGTFGEDSENTLKENLTEEEYEMVKNPEKPEVKIKFRILEWINS